MTPVFETPASESPKLPGAALPRLPQRLSSIGFYAVAVGLNLGLALQLLSVGLAYFDHPIWWPAHVWLGRGCGGLSLVLLAWAWAAGLPLRLRAIAAGLPLLVGLQVFTVRAQLPLPLPLAVLHPLIGGSLFSISTTLVHRAWQLVRPGHLANEAQ
jgi:Family of unknown function (DUF6220)